MPTRTTTSLQLFLASLSVVASAPSLLNNGSSHSSTDDKSDESRITVATFKWDEVESVYVIAIWLLVAGAAKLIFNRTKRLTSLFPESSLLIVVGLIIGYILMVSNVDHNKFQLDSHTFFIFLLPPIIFDAGYFMPNRAFFQNWDSIVCFAVFGTILNTLAIGGGLYALSQWDLFSVSFAPFEILLFSALISAVDPVAVIAVFEDIHVNDFIFVNVFGEALFNDGVTVVLYELFKQFLSIPVIMPIDIVAGAGLFCTVSIGGVFMGLLFAIFVSLLTRFSDQVLVLAPLFIFLVPYMGYLTAEMLSLSPIIAIAVCGMAMKQYVKGNITPTAANSVKYFTKVLAQSCETVIFMFLGLSTISFEQTWDSAFVLATILLCIVVRTVGVVVQCFLLNKFRGKKFTKVDQFILSYGGLRGAIAFGLAVSMQSSIQAKPMFVTTTIAVIFFTVFLQGSTIRPLVNYLNVEVKDEQEPTMTECVYGKYMDYIVSGVEDIAGQKGHTSLVHDFERFNSKVLSPILMKNHSVTKDFDATKIVRAYTKIILREAMVATTPKRLSTRSSRKVSPSNHSTIQSGQCICSMPGGNHSMGCPMNPSSPNLETLYSHFTEILDRKLNELRREMREQSEAVEKDDIGDDYMEQMHVPIVSNSRFTLAEGGRSGDAEAGRPHKRRLERSQTEGGVSSIEAPAALSNLFS